MTTEARVVELRVADMDPIEAQYSRAMHDLDCGSQGDGHEPPTQVDHPLEDHEPWVGHELEDEIKWPAIVRALRDRGLILAEIDSNERDENPYIRGYNRGWDDALEIEELPAIDYDAALPPLDPDPLWFAPDARATPTYHPEVRHFSERAERLAWVMIVLLLLTVFIGTMALTSGRTPG